MAQVLAVNPSLPYYYQIQGGLKPGQLFTINGYPKYDADRMQIDFTCGRGSNADIACHFNPRFDQNEIVLNWNYNNKWGKESSFPMCFHKGQNFQLVIEVQFSSFKFLVNGSFCAEYKSNIPMQRVTVFEICRGIQVEQVSVRNKSYTPSQPPAPGSLAPRPQQRPQYPPAPGSLPTRPQGFGPPPPGGFGPPPPGGFGPPPPGSFGPPPPGSYNPPARPPGMSNSNFVNPSIPFRALIPGGVNDGKMIYISGRPRQMPHRFNFDLVCSKTVTSDIAMHFDARFNPDNCVVRNSKINKSWGNEERHASYFPFQPGATFDMIIRIESSRIMVAVNGSHFTEYRHRIHPFTKIDTFVAEGDVSILSIKFA